MIESLNQTPNPSPDKVDRSDDSHFQNFKGYEAVFNPDAALKRLTDDAVGDLLDPQRTEVYRKAEFGPLDDEVQEGLKDPDHRREDIASLMIKHEAGITTNPDGTYTLSWERSSETPALTINSDGIIQPDTYK